MSQIEEIIKKQRAFYRSGKTLELDYRKQALIRLSDAIQANEQKLYQALGEDLHKSETESYMCEVGLTLSEIHYIRKHFKRWAGKRRVCTPLAQFHAKSFKVQEPYGVTLVMSPWNYPVLLCLEPLAGAIAAGNCCILKPSAYAPATSGVIKKLIGEAFSEDYVAVVEGGREANTKLLDQRFDYIFFTGGVEVGKLVMEKAARHLTPVTLELGGKSPCIIDASADLKTAARRLAFGKYLNSGQTCVAPDYLLIEEKIKDKFFELFASAVKEMLGEAPLDNPDYPKMINEKHYSRVMKLIEGERVVFGGVGRAESLQIAPTLLDGVTAQSPVMQSEIFGPVLPVLTYTDWSQVFNFILDREKPLALYLFSNDKKRQKEVLARIPFGGGCINDTVIHLATSRLGFGGVGASGMGSYHGKYSFDTFSHEKGIVKKYNWLDLPMRYQPYTRAKLKMIKMFLK